MLEQLPKYDIIIQYGNMGDFKNYFTKLEDKEHMELYMVFFCSWSEDICTHSLDTTALDV